MHSIDTVPDHRDITVSGDGGDLIEQVQGVLDRALSTAGRTRSAVTLTYAQSLDGCISARVGTSTPISNDQSRVITHRLRAIHDAILVGVNTVLVDDPQLTVREVEGDDPVPVVIDSSLRTPTRARLLSRKGGRPIVATVEGSSAQAESALTQAGAEVLRVAGNGAGGVDLEQVLECLWNRGLRSVMVEGGAGIITSFLREDLADQLLLTLSPTVLGGVRAVQSLDGTALESRPRLKNVCCQPLGDNLLIQGEFERNAQ